ncbi:SCO6880 family protein [Bifidobacterium crudilactis]|uniref:SCO6880 family protein n=1 Tax=Bifidobacterium crudilactis TaxID=327277 RepID=UPI000B194657
MAEVPGIPRVPLPSPALHRYPALVLTDLHPHAIRPSSPRHPQEEGRAYQRHLQRQKIGQIEDASQTTECKDVLQQEADLIAGHGILRYTGPITTPVPNELDAAVAAIEQAAIQAACETRVLVGQQAAACTSTAMPLCRGV